MDIKKIIAKLPVGFVEDAAGMDGDGLRAAIVRAEKLAAATTRARAPWWSAPTGAPVAR